MQLTELDELRSFKWPNGTGLRSYDLASTRVPMAVFYGKNDVLATPAIVENMMNRCLAMHLGSPSIVP